MHHDQIMESYTQLNNYLSNCVIKLHIKLQKHIKKGYVMLMIMKMIKMSTSFSRFQTEDVKNKQDLHRKDT